VSSFLGWLLFVAAVAVILFGIARAIRDNQRGWAGGITLTAAVGFGVAPQLLAIPVVLAFVYLTQVRRRIDRT
jgi:hypothetical protein